MSSGLHRTRIGKLPPPDGIDVQVISADEAMLHARWSAWSAAGSPMSSRYASEEIRGEAARHRRRGKAGDA